jgi:hypothetical protein
MIENRSAVSWAKEGQWGGKEGITKGYKEFLDLLCSKN